MDLASCTVDALVCDDSGTASALTWTSVGLGAAVVLVVALLGVLLLAGRRRRVRRAPVRYVFVDRWGDVVERPTR